MFDACLKILWVWDNWLVVADSWLWSFNFREHIHSCFVHSFICALFCSLVHSLFSNFLTGFKGKQAKIRIKIRKTNKVNFEENLYPVKSSISTASTRWLDDYHGSNGTPWHHEISDVWEKNNLTAIQVHPTYISVSSHFICNWHVKLRVVLLHYDVTVWLCRG